MLLLEKKKEWMVIVLALFNLRREPGRKTGVLQCVFAFFFFFRMSEDDHI
jgi:hypothetical protein